MNQEKKTTVGKTQFTNDNEYYTPRYVVDYFGKFDYDPATTVEKAADLEIPSFDTIETNGLKSDWSQYRRIWINPPFTKKAEFLAKAQRTYDQVKNDIYVLLPIEFLTTDRFIKACRGGYLYVPNTRINFESGNGKKGKSPAFGSIILKIGDENGVEFITLVKYDPRQLRIMP